MKHCVILYYVILLDYVVFCYKTRIRAAISYVSFSWTISVWIIIIKNKRYFASIMQYLVRSAFDANFRNIIFNSRTAIAGAIIGLLLVFYNSKNLNCIGALSFFLRSVHTFSWFLKSNWSSDFGHAETGNGAKMWVVLRREIFSL